MKRSLSIYVFRIFVHFAFVEQSNSIVDVVMRYTVEQDVRTDFFNFVQHN